MGYSAKVVVDYLKVEGTVMIRRYLSLGLMLFLSTLCWSQQKGQWVPGQYGLNAGVVPDPGFTYMNLAANYSADN